MALPLVYHWRNLFVRKTTTLLTMTVVTAVVGVFTWMMGFSDSLSRSLSTAADARKIIALKRGATSESNSAIPPDEYGKLNQLTQIERDPKTDQPLISPEMMVQVSLPRVRDQGTTWGNVALRGVTETAFAVHRNVKPTGRIFSTGSRELLVGLAAAKQFAGLEIGDKLQLGYSGDREYTIVGHFSADGGPLESEIWGYLPSLMNAYNRTMYSSAAIRVADGADPKSVVETIKGPAIQMDAQSEADYWREQSKNVLTYLMITRLLVTIMSLAAVFAIANTMFSTVAGRTREIAMLRTIGYSGRQILTGFVLEAVLLSLMGGVAGCLACMGWLWIVGNTKDMFGATTFTTLAFEIRLRPETVLMALGAVAAVGVVGAIIPAIRAAGVEVIGALREA